MHEDADANAAAAAVEMHFVEDFASEKAVARALGRALNATNAVAMGG